MKKNMKIIGIVAAVLMLVLATTPMAVIGFPSPKQSSEKPAVSIQAEAIPIGQPDPDEIVQIFLDHEDAVTAIGQYIIDWGESHGGLCCGGVNVDFDMPSDWELEFNAIQAEVTEYMNSVHQISVQQWQQGSSQTLPLDPVLHGISKDFFEEDGEEGIHYYTWLDRWDILILEAALEIHEEGAFHIGAALLDLIVFVPWDPDINVVDCVIIAAQEYCYGIDVIVEEDEGRGIYFFSTVIYYPLEKIKSYVDAVGAQ